MLRNPRYAPPHGFQYLEAFEHRILASTSLEATGPTIATLSAPLTSVVVADFNNDGVNDMVVASGRQILLYSGHGDGQFDAPRVFATLHADVGLLAVADFDGDHRPDLVAAQRSQPFDGAGWLRVLININGYQCNAVAFARTPGRISSVSVANLDGDAQPDILITTEFVPLPGGGTRPSALDWYERTGSTLAFRKRLDVAAGYSPVYVPAIADIDGDGRDEVISFAVRATNGTRIRMLRFDGSRIATISVLTLNTYITSGLVADLRSTGRQLVFASQFNGNSLNPSVERIGTIDLVIPALGAAAPTLGSVTPEIWSRVDAESTAVDNATPDLRILAVADLNSDGRTDIALQAGYDEGSNDAEAFGVALTQIIQNPSGDFGSADTHSFLYAWPGYLPTRSIHYDFAPYTIADLRGNGRLDMIQISFAPIPIFGYTDLNHPSLVVLRNTEVWKPPVVSAASLYTHPTGGPVTLSINAASTELARNAPVAAVRVYRDTNNNGLLDSADTLLGVGTTEEYSYYPERTGGVWKVDFAADPAWLHADVTLFVQATDTTGVLSEAVRYVLRLTN